MLPVIEASGVTYIRIGGIAANFFPPYDFSGTTITNASRLTNLITMIRDANMEAIIEVGFDPLSNCLSASPKPSLAGVLPADQATIAGNLVNYINNTFLATHPKGPIKYWIIANEPNLAIGGCSEGSFRGFGYGNYSTNPAASDARKIADYVKDFSTKMKHADPDIKIIAPEMTSFGTDKGYGINRIVNELLGGSGNSILGKIQTGNGAGKYYVDVMTIHSYPELNVADRQSVVNEPYEPNDGFNAKLIVNTPGTYPPRIGMIPMIQANALGRNPSNLTLGLTEYNLENSNHLHEINNAAGVAKGNDYRSFVGGQWLAEMLGIGMGNNWVSLMNFWSVRENGKSGDGCLTGWGILSPCNGSNRLRSTYHHFKMVSEYYKGGVFYPVTKTSGDNNLKVFAGTNNGNLVVMILNQNLNTSPGNATSDKSVAISFENNTLTTGNYNFKTANIGGTGAGTFNFSQTITDVDNESTWVFVYNSTGTLIKKCHYRLYGELLNNASAYLGLAPACTTFTTLAVTTTATGTCTGTSNGSITVNASSGIPPYTYALNGGTPQAGNAFTGLAAGTNTVTVKDNASPAATYSTTVTVTALPLPDVTANAAESFLCVGSSTTLFATGATTYLWSPVTGLLNPNAGSTQLTASIPGTLTYTVQGTDANGCTMTATAVIIAGTGASAIAISPVNAQTCAGTPVTLTATGAASYLWSNGATTPSIAVANDTAGTYTYTVTGTSLGCPSSPVTTTVTIHPAPVNQSISIYH